MNVPEYRSAVRNAVSRYRASVEAAAEELADQMTSIDDQFFEQQEKAALSR